MKTQILIIEDNFCKFFTTKQLLEAKLHLNVLGTEVQDASDLPRLISDFPAELVMFKPGSIVEVLDTFQKRGANCRNTEVTLVLVEEIDEENYRRIFNSLQARQNNNRRPAQAA